MSIVRWGTYFENEDGTKGGSSLYIYESTSPGNPYVCCDCSLIEEKSNFTSDEDFEAFSALELAEHLKEHQAAWELAKINGPVYGKNKEQSRGHKFDLSLIKAFEDYHRKIEAIKYSFTERRITIENKALWDDAVKWTLDMLEDYFDDEHRQYRKQLDSTTFADIEETDDEAKRLENSCRYFVALAELKYQNLLIKETEE